MYKMHLGMSIYFTLTFKTKYHSKLHWTLQIISGMEPAPGKHNRGKIYLDIYAYSHWSIYTITELQE